jgi:cytochrome b561
MPESTAQWGLPVRIMHAAGLVLIFILIGHGWWITWLAAGDERLAHIVWHASFGYAVLVLTVLRMAWRGNAEAPPPPAGSLKWERNLAALGHMGLYLLTLGTSVQGWALAGTFADPLNARLLGIIPMPMIMSGTSLHDPLLEMHSLFAWLLVGLVLLHIMAVVYHQYHKRDGLLQRMFWSSGQSVQSQDE